VAAVGGTGRSPSWRVSSAFIRTGSTTGRSSCWTGRRAYSKAVVARAHVGKRSVEKRCPSDGGPRVRIHLPPAESHQRTIAGGATIWAEDWLAPQRFDMSAAMPVCACPKINFGSRPTTRPAPVLLPPVSSGPALYLQHWLFFSLLRHERLVAFQPQTPAHDRIPDGGKWP
jgi:hypothetical protein